MKKERKKERKKLGRLLEENIKRRVNIQRKNEKTCKRGKDRKK